MLIKDIKRGTKDMKKHSSIQRVRIEQEKITYRTIIWSVFMMCVMAAGCMMAMIYTWGDISLNLTVPVIMLLISMLFCMSAKLLAPKFKVSWVLLLLPWFIQFVIFGFADCITGMKTWINILISQWNLLNKADIRLLYVSESDSGIQAFSSFIALCIGEFACLAVIYNRIFLSYKIE